MIDYELKDLFSETSISKQFIITSDDESISISNDDLLLETFSLTESINSGNQLDFGSCEAGQITFSVYGIENTLKGTWLTVKVVLEDNTDKPFTIGRYKVNSDQLSNDKKYREVVAYDLMYDIINTDVTDWYNAISFPITIKGLRDSFANHFGIDQADITLCNDSVEVEKTLSDTSTISGKDILYAIGQLNGVYPHINRDNKLVYIALNTTYTEYPSKKILPTFEDYTCQNITQLEIRPTSDSVGVLVGEEGVAYVIEGNIFTLNMDNAHLTTVATNLLPVIAIPTYRPFSCDFIGNPCYEVGDGISITTDEATVNSYILSRTIKGIQSLTDSVEAKGVEEYEVEVNTINSQLKTANGRYAKLSSTVDELSSEIHKISTPSVGAVNLILNSKGYKNKTTFDDYLGLDSENLSLDDKVLVV